MIRILLADDEDFIRQGIRYTIPWEENDMSIVGEASDGADALRQTLELKPDIILADIQMPIMDGLTLTQKVKTLLPNTKIIILTAYGSTENLKHAIDVNVDAFVLKTADSEAILSSVKRIKEEFMHEQAEYEKTEHLKGIYDENRHLIKATLVSRFLSNQISFSTFCPKAQKLNINFQSTQYAILLIKCSGCNEQHTLGQLYGYFQDFAPFVFFVHEQMAVVLLDTAVNIFDEVALQNILPSLLPLVLGSSIVAMNNIKNYSEFPLAYAQLLRAIEKCFWHANNRIALLSPHDEIERDVTVNTFSIERTLVCSILDKNVSVMKSGFESYYAFMRENSVPRQLFLDSITRILVLVSAISQQAFSIDETLESICELETPLEIVQLLESLALPENMPVAHSQINIALSYMSDHFTEDLYLDDVAKASFLSSGYLSRIFRQETGFSFKEYVHILRVKKAQELLLTTDYKYYEIAEIVGYKNYKYFSSYFHKLTGCSAKEFKFAKR